MTMIFGVPLAVFLGQLLLGLINGAFYALLSLGLAVIFGLLKIVNFAHGAMYMLGPSPPCSACATWGSTTGPRWCWHRWWWACSAC